MIARGKEVQDGSHLGPVAQTPPPTKAKGEHPPTESGEEPTPPVPPSFEAESRVDLVVDGDDHRSTSPRSDGSQVSDSRPTVCRPGPLWSSR